MASPASTRALALIAGAALVLLAGCASGPRGGSGIGRDGPDANPPAGLGQVPDAEPRVEAIRGSGGTSKPYVVLGRSYVPIADDRPWRETGLASWYGRKFHAQSTASGEPYDMYAMTAAHKTLPLPSYVRVRNPANGREAIVRVNDRGPFHDDRIIDLSYTAAYKLDLLRGVAPVEIERITNADIRAGTWRRGDTALAQAAPAQAPMAIAEVPLTPTAADAVAVPAALTSPVVAMPRAEVRELDALPPLPAAAAETAPATAASESPPAPPTSGFWVQLGAFSQRDGVERFQQQVARSLPALAGALNVFAERGTYRLQAGPYASRDQARDMAEQARNGLQLAPMIVERR
ncbi:MULTISPECIES: septal ring lytic transglycosylase RlpA family protein [unclassified Variovorax]|uniref:septal ring lytic transglycosylase RlpA family protein n=3 Tax=Variovorax TaxID=34072 RepID=UPI000C9ABDF3|nr:MULTISPECIES: septal ring lytic transglycosylase RlpA family protein [unclassified Variovorax]PNG58410.1 RlpA-like protein [Variovorax sp. B4]PNG61800.1 RlpA-like protein [Variovorax sp. B2]VTV12138.1 RlpA-like protein precursor [Variovorax sp. WDL1]